MQPADPDAAPPARPGAAFFQVLLESQADVIVVLGRDGAIRYATPSAAALFGQENVTGAYLPDLVGPESRTGIADVVSSMLEHPSPDSGDIPQGIWHINMRPGRSLHVQVHSSDLRGTQAVGGLVLTLRDITGQYEREQQLRQLATRDMLTGLVNRGLFTERTARAADLARATRTTAAVMFVDVDDFKTVNDTRGHQAGDELLAAAAARLAGAVRGSDTTGRYGGDEFVILLEGLPGPAAAWPFADRVVQAFADPFTLSGGQVTISASVSVGLATTADSADTETLLAHADLALYAAKRAGKGRWAAYSPEITVTTPAGAAPPPLRGARLEFPAPVQEAIQAPAAAKAPPSPGRRLGGMIRRRIRGR